MHNILQKAKIVMVCEGLPPKCGGGGRVALELAKRMEDCVLVGFDEKDGVDFVENVGVIRIKRGLIGYLKMIKTLLNTNPKIFHGHGFRAGFIAWVAGIVKRKPKVLHIHGFAPLEVSGYFKYIAKFVIFSLPFDARISVDEEGLKGKRGFVIPNGVDTEMFKCDNKRRENNTFLFVGRLVKEKGLDILKKACERLDNVKVYIIGSGPEEKNLHGKNIIVLGRHERQEDIVSWYCKADFFVLPSRSEGHPLVLLEAMACGLPIVASDIPQIKKYLEGTGNLLFRKNDWSDLAEKMKRMINMSEEEYIKISKNNRKIAEKYSWEKVIKKVKNVYKQILKGDSFEAEKTNHYRS